MKMIRSRHIIILSIVITMAMILSSGVFATSESTYEPSNSIKISIKEEREDIIKDIKEEAEKEKTSFDNPQRKEVVSVIEKVLNKHKNHSTVRVFLDSHTKSIFKIDEQSFILSDNITVSFVDQFVIVNVFTESQTDENQVNQVMSLPLINKVVEPVYAASGNKKKTASNSAYLYDLTVPRLKVVTAFIEAEFTYNKTKKTCTARRTSHYMKPYLPLVSVYGLESAVQKPSKSKRVAYQSGYASGGLNYQGNGINIWTRYMRVNVACDYAGKITKSKKIS